ncbi:hypothetical protein [Arthrobacter sp. DR-2P]|nr:hypothetical protein [Arthrobacter sp. DR-2P]
MPAPPGPRPPLPCTSWRGPRPPCPGRCPPGLPAPPAPRAARPTTAPRTCPCPSGRGTPCG